VVCGLLCVVWNQQETKGYLTCTDILLECANPAADKNFEINYVIQTDEILCNLLINPSGQDPLDSRFIPHYISYLLDY
jgi:hypothetical protein